MSKAILDKLAAIEARQSAVDDRLKTISATRNHGASPWTSRDQSGGGVPGVRTGANVLGSAPFSFCKLFASMYEKAYAPDAKNEINLCERTHALCIDGYKSMYRPMGGLVEHCVPVWPESFGGKNIEGTNNRELYYEMKQYLEAGVDKYDPDEAAWVQKKLFSPEGKAAVAGSPSMSAQDQSVGGSFVPPPMFGPPIELLRNKEVMMRAGATVLPLGPSGRIIMPRLTVATQASMSQENNPVQPVNAGTGYLELKGKKIMGNILFPGELIRFGSPACEQMVRNDLMTSVALLADYQYLQGPGSDTQIYGMATLGAKGDLNTITPTTANQLAPQDCYAFMSAVEENNGEFTVWIMRPKMTYAWYQSRWTPYSGGTSQGGFVFEMMRGFGDKPRKYLAGVEVVDSAQVSNTRGNGSQTYVLGGMGNDYVIALFGAISMRTTQEGYTLMASDQVLINAMLTTDGAPRRPSCWSFADSLNFTIAP